LGQSLASNAQTSATIKAIDFREKQHDYTKSPVRSSDDCKMQHLSASLHWRKRKHVDHTEERCYCFTPTASLLW